MARLTILIVSFNTRAELEDCLTSIAASPATTPCDVVVVDNASSDDTAEALQSRWPGVRLIRNDRNLGFAGANNVGIRAVESELVLLLNSDTLLRPRSIDVLVAALDADSSLAAVGPRLVDGAGRVELSFGRMMGPFAELWQKALGTLHARGVWPFARHVERLTRRASYPEWLSGACLLVRRADAIAAGLLDERYFLYAEDVDFCAALRALGKRLSFVPDAVVVHLKGRSRRTRPAQSERAYRESQLTFYAKHHPRWVPLLRAYLRVRGKLPSPPPA